MLNTVALPALARRGRPSDTGSTSAGAAATALRDRLRAGVPTALAAALGAALALTLAALLPAALPTGAADADAELILALGFSAAGEGFADGILTVTSCCLSFGVVLLGWLLSKSINIHRQDRQTKEVAASSGD
jgi:hypothetical protein